MTNRPIGFHGTENRDPSLVDSWERNSHGKEISYTIRAGPSKLAFIYYCQIIEKMQGRSATETILGGEKLSREEVEKLPKFVALLA